MHSGLCYPLFAHTGLGFFMHDHEFKRITYRQLPGLQEYLLMAQSSCLVICYRRPPDGREQACYGTKKAVELKKSRS